MAFRILKLCGDGPKFEGNIAKIHNSATCRVDIASLRDDNIGIFGDDGAGRVDVIFANVDSDWFAAVNAIMYYYRRDDPRVVWVIKTPYPSHIPDSFANHKGICCKVLTQQSVTVLTNIDHAAVVTEDVEDRLLDAICDRFGVESTALLSTPSAPAAIIRAPPPLPGSRPGLRPNSMHRPYPA